MENDTILAKFLADSLYNVLSEETAETLKIANGLAAELAVVIESLKGKIEKRLQDYE